MAERKMECYGGQVSGGLVYEESYYHKLIPTPDSTGCRFITVDAYAAAIPFYLRNGFVPLNEEDTDDPTRLLYFDLNDLDED